MLSYKEAYNPREHSIPNAYTYQEKNDTYEDERHGVATCMDRNGRGYKHPYLVQQHRQTKQDTHSYRYFDFYRKGIGNFC